MFDVRVELSSKVATAFYLLIVEDGLVEVTVTGEVYFEELAAVHVRERAA